MSEQGMDDRDIRATISRLVEEEHQLRQGKVDEAERRKLTEIEEHLDQAWDLLRQRQALREAAGDPTQAHERPTGYVAVHMFAGMPWEPYFRAVEAIMDEYDGRPHWGKRHFQTAETLRPRYPRWEEWQAVRARLDPDGRFSNAYSDRVIGTVSNVRVER